MDIDTEAVARKWWAIAIRGAVAIIFGILAIVMPIATLAVLVLLFGSFAFVDGIFAIVAAARRHESDRPYWAMILEGIVGIAVGVMTFVWPDLAALSLVWVIAAWSLITGVLEIAAAIRLRKEIRGEFWLALSGVLSIVFAGLLMAMPGAGALALVLWIGVYAIVSGAFLLGFAFRLRSWRQDAREPLARAA